MNNKFKRALSSILAFVMVITTLTVMNVSSVFADDTTYTYNFSSVLSDTNLSSLGITLYSFDGSTLKDDNLYETYALTSDTVINSTDYTVTINSGKSPIVVDYGTSYLQTAATEGTLAGTKLTRGVFNYSGATNALITISSVPANYNVEVYYSGVDSSGNLGKSYGATITDGGSKSTAGSTTTSSSTPTYVSHKTTAEGNVTIAPSSNRIVVLAVVLSPAGGSTDGTLTYDSNTADGGTITVTNSEGELANNATVTADDELTVNVEAAEGYIIGSVSVNDNAVTLDDDGNYTFSVDGDQDIYVIFNKERTAITDAITLTSDTSSAYSLEYGSESTADYYFTYESSNVTIPDSSTPVIRVGSSAGIVFNTGSLTGTELTMVVTYTSGSSSARGLKIKDNTAGTSESYDTSSSTSDTKTATYTLSANSEYQVISTTANLFIQSLVITAETIAPKYVYFGITADQQKGYDSYYISTVEGGTELATGDTVYSGVAYEGDDSDVKTVDELITNGDIDDGSAYVVAYLVSLSSGKDVTDLHIYFKQLRR